MKLFILNNFQVWKVYMFWLLTLFTASSNYRNTKNWLPFYRSFLSRFGKWKCNGIWRFEFSAKVFYKSMPKSDFQHLLAALGARPYTSGKSGRLGRVEMELFSFHRVIDFWWNLFLHSMRFFLSLAFDRFFLFFFAMTWKGKRKE